MGRVKCINITLWACVSNIGTGRYVHRSHGHLVAAAEDVRGPNVSLNKCLTLTLRSASGKVIPKFPLDLLHNEPFPGLS